MPRKKSVSKRLQDYGRKHPYVSLGLAGLFGYHVYDSFVKPRMADEGPSMYNNPAGLGMTTSTSTTTSSSHIPNMMRGDEGEPSMHIPAGSGLFGVTKSNPHCHCGAGMGGYPNCCAGMGAVKQLPKQEEIPYPHMTVTKLQGVKNNPASFLKYDQTQQLSGFSPSARRRIGHASGSSGLGYSPTLDTQFENREAMMMGDLKKHSDILGLSGLMPLAGGDWYE